ncbi:DUF1501 domain-containing protein [Dechloromonas sp. ZS-1]|uniref:DUF1501 domain-containing protein n=1 Tax=Dechloromonas sp. ZS-1 TaxID=3138067 RepID=UPI0031FC4A9E
MSDLNRQRRRLLGAGLLSAALPAFALERPERPDGRFIFLFLRGGLDGLFAFAPAADPRLASLRPGLAKTVLSDGQPLGSTGFAAHPSCRALSDLFARRELAFAPCAGTPDKSRSHFQAQDLFELGNGDTRGQQGWLARAGEAWQGRFRLIGFTANPPLALQGATPPADLMPLAGSSLQVRQNRSLDAIMAMHAQQASGRALDQAMQTQAELDAIQGMDARAARGAAGINGFARSAETMARVLRDNPRLAMAFLDLGGFDTHANQENSLGRSLPQLGEGLLALKTGLGEAEWRRTQVLICTEFGRTVRENGTQGTDHGHGSLALLAGGALRQGGRMLGDFAGLADSALNEGRDLPVRVDWRSLIGRVLQDTQGFPLATLQRILPGLPGLA